MRYKMSSDLETFDTQYHLFIFSVYSDMHVSSQCGWLKPTAQNLYPAHG